MQKLTTEFNKAVVKKGDIFCIELPSNPTTGYKWDLQLKEGKASLVQKHYISDPAVARDWAGGGGRQVFIYQADEPGVIEIDATYKQPWKGGNTAQSKSFVVTTR